MLKNQFSKLLVLLFLGLIIACSNDDDTSQQDEIIQTFVKTQTEIVSVSANSIILSGNQEDVAVNDIVVSGANANAPYGFLRKVTAISSNDQNTTLQTSRTSISEAVKHFYEDGEQFQDGFSYSFQASDSTRTSGGRNQQVPFTVPLNETITTSQGGVPIDISLIGEITINPSIVCDVTISSNLLIPSLDEFVLEISSDNSIDVSVLTEFNGSFDTEDVQLGSFTSAPITITVGIPIVLIPKFTLFVGASGDLNANITYNYQNNSIAQAGVMYNEGWQFLEGNGFNVTSQEASATASVSGNIRAYVKPEFSLSLYDDDFVSGGINVEPYARFEGEVTANQYSYAIFTGIDTGAFFQAQAFGFSLIDQEWNNLINIPEWEIDSGGATSATLSNIFPQDESTITAQPITFSWQPNNFSDTPTYELLIGTDINDLQSVGTTSNEEFIYNSTLQDDTYFWNVIARNPSNEIIAESLIYRFFIEQNQAVGPVTNPLPSNSATDIAVNGNLSFTEGTNTPTDATFKVYFDTSTDPTTVFDLDADTNTLNYSNLQEGTVYYWKVETVSNSGDVLATSPIWSFTTLTTSGNTEPVFNPTPNDGASEVAINGSLSFTAGANTPGDATYRLYFDTNTTPTAQFNLGNQTSYSYSNLQEDINYYWYVETLDNTGAILATSDVWSFETENIAANVFNGDVTLTTQIEVDNFGSNNYSEITGDLIIGTNFSSPSNIISLISLNSLSSVGGELDIKYNPSLNSLDGLSNLNSVSEGLVIIFNDSLISLEGLESLIGVEAIYIGGNINLETLNGIENLTSAGSIGVGQAFFNVETFWANPQLTNFCSITDLITNGQYTSGTYQVNGNGYNPTVDDIINGNCSL